jgi:hypothetical protein
MRVVMVMLVTGLCAGAVQGQPCSQQGAPYFEFQVEVPARFIPDSTVSPRPAGAPGVRGDDLPALVQFVVDTAGVPDTRSYKILVGRDAQLVAAGRDVLTRWRFVPARLGGCPVRQLVQTPLTR